MNSLQLRKSISTKRAAAKAILAACGEAREMTPEESAQFDALLAEVESLKAKLAQLSQVEGDESNADEPEPEGRGRSASIVGQAPAIHTRGKGRYSILRALSAAYDGRRLDGIEGEVNAELARQAGRNSRAGGFFLPSGNEVDPELRGLMGYEVRADATTTTAAGAIFTKPTAEPFIDALRSRLVLQDLGATFMTGLSGGKFAMSRLATSAGASWTAENTAITATSPTLDQVVFQDQTLIGMVNISAKLLAQSSLSVEQMVTDDIVKSVAIKVDGAAFNGTGTNQPLGLFSNSTIATQSANAQGGTNGAALTNAKAIMLESIVAAANADRGKLAYVTSPSVRGKLKGTEKSTGYPVFVWADDEINGYRAIASSLIPNNLTKGSSANVCSAIAFGNWEDLVVAQWGAVEILVNPYTLQGSAGLTISAHLEADIQVRHPESFAIITDVLYS